jgi:hypothetical protein
MSETYDINEISNNRYNTTDTNFLDAVTNFFIYKKTISLEH